MATVTLIEYQSDWPAQFRETESELRPLFAGLAVRIEHIGSTSVEGLRAKPVIDILLGARALSEIESRAEALSGLGYRYRPEHEAELPDRRYFTRQDENKLRIHLHGVIFGSVLWRNHLAFRDALRADSDLSHRYAALKRELAQVHADDRAAYTEAKGLFIVQVLDGLTAAQD